MSEEVFGPSLQREREKARHDKRVQQDLANWPDRLRTMVALAYEQLQRSTTPPVETLSDGQSVMAWVYPVQGSRGIAITTDGELSVAFMLGLPLPPRLSERRVTELPWARRYLDRASLPLLLMVLTRVTTHAPRELPSPLATG